MMLKIVALTCVMALSVSGYDITKAKMDSALQQTGAQHLAMVQVKYYSELGANVLETVALEGETYRGVPFYIGGAMPFVEPQEGSLVHEGAEGEFYTLSITATDPPRYTGTKSGKTIVGGVTVQNSDGERVVVVAQFDSELDADQLAQAAAAVDTITNNIQNQ